MLSFPYGKAMKKKEVQTYVYTSSYFMFARFIPRTVKKCQLVCPNRYCRMLDKTPHTKQNLYC